MITKLNVLTEMGNEHQKAILLEIPTHVLEQLNVENHKVNTIDLIRILVNGDNSPALDLTKLIFDTSFAVTPKSS